VAAVSSVEIYDRGLLRQKIVKSVIEGQNTQASIVAKERITRSK